MKKTAVLCFVTLVLQACTTDSVPTEPTLASPVLRESLARPSIIPGQYVVQTRDGEDPSALVAEYGVTPDLVYGKSRVQVRQPGARALTPVHPRRGASAVVPQGRQRVFGFAARLSEQTVARLRQDPRVKRIEPDRYGYPTWDGYTALAPTTRWNLDRLDQPASPLDGWFASQGDGGRYVSVYVVDSGVRLDHQQFEGRAYFGADFWDGTRPPSGKEDCSGHGTGVASLIGGKDLGVARAASLISVRMISCPREDLGAKLGLTTYGKALAALQWVLQDKLTYLPTAGAVANLSWDFSALPGAGNGWGGPESPDSLEMLQDAVRDLMTAGVTVVASAGNSGVNACTSVPGRLSLLEPVITVGAMLVSENRLLESNHGTCVSLSAPGDTMTVAGTFWEGHERLQLAMTSGAAAHVSGVAALYLALHPASSPAQVKAGLIYYAHQYVLKDVLTPSKLLVSSRFIDWVAVIPDQTRLLNNMLGINETIAAHCRGFLASGAELDHVRCRWRSSDTTVAVVSPAGAVMGRAPGNITIYGESGPDQDSVNFTVLAPFRVEPSNVTLRNTVYVYNQMVGPGGTTTLVEWWMGNGEYSTGENALTRYRAPGSYTITMRIHGPAGSVTYSKTVNVR